MFGIFFKKTRLQDLIPDGFVDIHSHLLPAIDDGAQTIEDTLALHRSLSSMGFGGFVTTPHIMKAVWENTPATISKKLLETNAALAEKGISPLRAAAEYLIDANFAALFRTESLLTLKDNYVLVEMSYINPPIQLYEILFDLQVAGYKPVLAHPERYLFYHQNFAEFEKLRHAGCQFQINLLSTVGYYGLGVADCARKLLKKGMVTFAGSDVHHDKHIAAFSRPLLTGNTAPLREAMANNRIFGI